MVVDTITSREQRVTETSVMEKWKDFLKEIEAKGGDDSEIYLNRQKHTAWLKKHIFKIPDRFSGLNASRPWFCYWIAHALELLEEDDFIDNISRNLGSFLAQCQNRTGGLGGGPMQMSHLATTYSGTAALALGNNRSRTADGKFDDDRSNMTFCPLSIIDRQSLYQFLMSMKDPATGGFRMHANGETDIRGTYCAIAVASMTQILTPELAEGVDRYVLSNQSWDGGLSGESGLEAHGGYTYCGLSALAILGIAYDVINMEKLVYWLSHRQMKLEGGYQGRTNKLVDSCYSFWQGASFTLVREAYEMKLYKESVGEEKFQFKTDLPNSNPKIRSGKDGKSISAFIPTPPLDNNWTQSSNLQMYVLLACQEDNGGLKDKPTTRPDFYHSCYALSGMSTTQFTYGKDRISETIVGNECNKLRPIDPFYNIGLDKSFRLQEYFNPATNPSMERFISPTGQVGCEGEGVVNFRKKFSRPGYAERLEVDL